MDYYLNATKGGAATCQIWVQKVISRYMDVKLTTLIEEIRSMLRIQYAKVISYKVAQCARLELQGSDLATHCLSFKLLLAYF
jgi:hypothetical protein